MSSDDDSRGQSRAGSENGGGRWRRAGGPPPERPSRSPERPDRAGGDRHGGRGKPVPGRGAGGGRSRGLQRDGRRGDAPGGRRSGSDTEGRPRGEGGTRGPRSWDRARGQEDAPRRREPEIPEGVTGRELDRAVWRELRTLTKENAEGVAQHLVASALSLEVDTDLALEHAQTAARRAGRVAAAREALGLVHYRRGEFNDALREFRTARRLSGSHHLLPYMVDCERGLGRLQRALDLASSPEAKTLGEQDNIELAIVVSGVRRDLGQPDAALMGLRLPALKRAKQQPWAARLLYAYAEALLATDDVDGAHEFFARAVTADQHQETDAAERLGELEGITLEDLGWDEDDAPEADGELGEAAAGSESDRSS